MTNDHTIFVATWNVNRNNILSEKKFDFFKEADIIFLQEVNEKSLLFLQEKSNFFEIYHTKEILKKRGIKIQYHIVTLVNKKSQIVIKRKKKIPLKTTRSFIYKISRRSIDIECHGLDTVVKKQALNCSIPDDCLLKNRRGYFIARDILPELIAYIHQRDAQRDALAAEPTSQEETTCK